MIETTAAVAGTNLNSKVADLQLACAEQPHDCGTRFYTQTELGSATSYLSNADGLGRAPTFPAFCQLSAKALGTQPTKGPEPQPTNAEVTGAGAPAEGTKSATLLASG